MIRILHTIRNLRDNSHEWLKGYITNSRYNNQWLTADQSLANWRKQTLSKHVLIHRQMKEQGDRMTRITSHYNENIFWNTTGSVHLTLRSSDANLLCVPRVHTCFGSRGFSVAAPNIWNSLPLDIRNSCSIASFRCQLKTFLFSISGHL